MMRRSAPAKTALISAYFTHHVRVFIATLGYLSRQPVASLMTTAVIAIALALPTGLYIALNVAGGVSADWDDSTQLSLYMHTHVNEKQASAFASKLRLRNDIKQVSIIDKEQGLEQFREQSGFGDALKLLDNNPLPVVLIIQPEVDPANPGMVNHLVAELQKDKLVELAQLDTEWVKRLYALLDIAQRAIWVIAALLGLAVLLIVGNTIRLDIQNRRAEIEVSRLIGASDAFIRRPFLYTGLWYGLSGGLLAWLLTSISLWILQGPAQKLALLYHSAFSLDGLDVSTALGLIAISCLLGLSGSWLAVGRHLSQIEPS